MEALRAPEHAGQRLDGGAHEVDLGLLRGERHPGGLRVEPQLERALTPRAVVVVHPPRPDSPRRAVLGDLLEEVDVRVEEERQARREVVDREADGDAASTYANPLASVNASSCAAVEPASRMWYPEIDTGWKRGISAVQNRIVSATRRIDGRGGKMNSFCAWYSFRMSFWSVPPSAARSTPLRSAAATYIASTMAAGPLIVIDVVTAPRSMPA